MRFYCKDLGTFRITTVQVFRVYRDTYSDMVRVTDEGMLYLFDDYLEYELSKEGG